MRAVALLTDFGLEDSYAGVLHAVLLRDAPGVQRIDLSHMVPPGNLWHASYLLRSAWEHLPADVVVLAVVDPGVGSERRAVAVRLGDRWLVAPDNGLPVAVGPPSEGVTLDAVRMGLPEPSATFHGRDLFAPAAARLARGVPSGDLGEPLDPGTLVSCPLPEPRVEGNRVQGVIQHVDRFGNLVTNIPAAMATAGCQLRAGWRRITHRVRTYAEGRSGEAVCLVGSSGFLEISVPGGSAAEQLTLETGDPVELLPPDTAL